MSSIELNNVDLDYILKTGSESFKKTAIHACRQLLGRSKENVPTCAHSSYRALHQINLNFQEGDRVGLLGRNGAGKSTLLRVLAKVYKPNAGRVHIEGRISSLFDVHLGMNPDATGYENIVNLAVMRACSKKAIQAMMADIVAFTELGAFLSHPVRTYSTGMQMKLAFAVATAFSPDIMLIDEIIGAGDAHFMQKATERLQQLIEKSHILVLTSHANEIVRRFCNKVVVLKRGEVQFVGPVEEGILLYESMT